MHNLLLYMECRTVDKAISDLEMKLVAARAERETIMKDPMISEDLKNVESTLKRKYFMVIGINTAFSSRERRDSVRATWIPQGALTVFMEVFSLMVLFFSYDLPIDV